MHINNLSVVLDRPQNPANIGAVVRALRNFGFQQLRLVQPAPFDRTDLLRYAHRCDALINAMTLHDTLDEALHDAVFVVGTAAQAHPDRPHTRDIRALAETVATRSRDGTVALLFGTEGDGLDRAALDRCHMVASLPTEADYPALNLAQSVLLFLYQMHQTIPQGQMPLSHNVNAEPSATHQELERIFAGCEELLTRIGYIRYSPESLMRTLRQLVHRAQLTQRDAAILLGIMAKLRQLIPPPDET